MATRGFELETTVPVAPSDSIDFLADLAAHRGLHPFLVGADPVAHGEDADGPWTAWRVVERPALGPFRYTIRFAARMQRTSPTTLVGTVHAAPGCSLVTRTSATATATGALVREATTVSAPTPLVGYMTAGARTAHERTFARLAAELAAR